MQYFVENLVNIEINELIYLGWMDCPLEADNLLIAARLTDDEVSFPHESYNLEVGNEDAVGVWAKWRSKQILRTLKQHGIKLLWEIGSGHGNVAIPLQSEGIAVIGIEPLVNGAKITAKSGVRTYLGTLESLRLPSNSISAIGIFDVLEHLEKPDLLLSEIYRVLRPGGLLLALVPAHQWLFSDFDKSIGHYRRYSRKVLYRQLKQSQFVNIKIEFMFSIFVLPALIIRKLPSLSRRPQNIKKTIKSSNIQTRIINVFEPIIMPLLHLERKMHFPFGLSLFSISKK